MSADRRRHPLATGCPPVWASSWGQDRLGVFAGFMVREREYRMRWIAEGSFLMGSPDGGPERISYDGPQHLVTLTRGFWLGEAPVTQALWGAVMGENPSHFDGPNLPVEQVSWDDCQRLCARLQRIIPGLNARLPTEAEWEYACRAGTITTTYAGQDSELDAIAWWSGNSQQQTHIVKQKTPNAWGLYDTLGNVWEWCSDSMHTYIGEPAIDPIGAANGALRVYRGGGWYDDARVVHAASRVSKHTGSRYHNLGCRLAHA